MTTRAEAIKLIEKIVNSGEAGEDAVLTTECYNEACSLINSSKGIPEKIMIKDKTEAIKVIEEFARKYNPHDPLDCKLHDCCDVIVNALKKDSETGIHVSEEISDKIKAAIKYGWEKSAEGFNAEYNCDETDPVEEFYKEFKEQADGE